MEERKRERALLDQLLCTSNAILQKQLRMNTNGNKALRPPSSFAKRRPGVVNKDAITFVNDPKGLKKKALLLDKLTTTSRDPLEGQG